MAIFVGERIVFLCYSVSSEHIYIQMNCRHQNHILHCVIFCLTSPKCKPRKPIFYILVWSLSVVFCIFAGYVWSNWISSCSIVQFWFCWKAWIIHFFDDVWDWSDFCYVV